MRRFAYADPPYLGCSVYYADHPQAEMWDDAQSHIDLVNKMDDEYDGWALSLSSSSLREILPFTPERTRTAAWVKPFAVFRPNNDPAYCWEPLLFKTLRKWSKDQPTCRDYVSAKITLQKGVIGAKPKEFALWLFTLLGATPDDDFTDLFPGTGGVSAVWQSYCDQYSIFHSMKP